MGTATGVEDPRRTVTGVVLAGGRGQRMGGADKGLVLLAGRELARHVLDALRPQVHEVIINANRNTEAYARMGCRVIGDALGGFHGPLAGMASAMRAARTRYIATVPCDAPFLPVDLVARLYAGLRAARAEIAAAEDGERLQPVFALLDCALLPALETYLARGERKIDRWYAEHRCTRVSFADHPRAFLNVNTPEEIAAAERELAAGDARSP